MTASTVVARLFAAATVAVAALAHAGVLASKSGKRVTIEFPVTKVIGTAADNDDVVLHVSY